MEAIEVVDDEVKINIFPRQADFIASTVDDALFGGSAGSGKSFALLIFSAKRRMEHPGTNGIIFRRTFPELDKSIIRESLTMYPFFGAKYNSTKREWRFPNGSVQEFGYCFDDRTEILTEDGWKLFENLSKTDKVSTLDDKGRIRFVTPSDHISYLYGGKMISIQQKNGVDICCTPNHKFFVKKLYSGGKKKRKWSKWMFEKASEFKGTRRIQRSFNQYCSVRSNYVHFPKVKGGHRKIIKCKREPFSKFLGWFLAEGCLAKQKYDIYIYQKVKLKELIQDIKKCGFRFFIIYPKDKTGVPKVCISSKELHSWLKKRYGGLAFEKRIPKECMGWPKKCLRNILDGLVLGDGSKNKRRPNYLSVNYGTTSKLLADDIQELCLRIGLRATIYKRKGGARSFRGKAYKCWEQFGLSIREGQFTEFRRNNVKEIDYLGMVYCVEVNPFHKIIVRRNGRAYLAGNCERAADVYKFQSAEYADMCFDELTHFSEFQFSYLTSRCRTSKEGIKPLIRCATNPGNIGHVFCYKRYIEPSLIHKIWKDEVTGKTLTFIPAKISDNPALAEADPGYIKRLKELPEKKYLALAEGRWDVFEGEYFREWNPTPGMGVLPGPRVPEKDHLKYLCLDWGYANPAAIYWLELTPYGKVYAYRELYVTELGPKKLAKQILDMCPKDETYEWMSASPEIWGKKTELDAGGEPIQEIMQGVFGDRIIMQKANNARVPGWMKMREYMMLAPDGRPWFQVSPDCPNLIRTIPGIIHSEKRPEDVDDKCDDDCVEAIRYGLVSLSDVPKSELNPYESNYDKIFGRRTEVQENMSDLPLPHSGY